MNIGIFNFIFGTKSITEDKIRDFVADTNAKRICFSRIQKHPLWKTSDGENMLTVPFENSIGTLLKEQTSVVLRKSRKGKYYSKLPGEDFNKVTSFISSYSDVVFLRDLLDCSVALSLNFEDDMVTHTPVGLLEKKAKYENNREAIDQLATLVDEFIGNNPPYKNADCICAVPPTKVGEQNLPISILERLSQFNGKDISSAVEWKSKNESLKNADSTDKLEILKQSGFSITDGTDINGKDIVLVDDLYMSGTTLQYVAMKLKEAGAREVYGLCIVKSLSNK